MQGLFMLWISADVAELADAHDLGSCPKGWEFNSPHPHFLRKLFRGRSSTWLERHVANVKVKGSIPSARSNLIIWI